MINPDIEERYEELYEQATVTYLDKTDFNACDWLDEDEQKEFLECQKHIFEEEHNV